MVPEGCSDALRNAANRLKNKLNSVTGAFFILTENITGNNEIIDSQADILLGNCKRTETQQALSLLRYRDYAVKITDSGLLIATYDNSRVSDGVKDLITWIEGDGHIVKRGNQTYLIWEEDLHGAYGKGYPLEALSINGVSIEEADPRKEAEYSLFYVLSGLVKVNGTSYQAPFG